MNILEKILCQTAGELDGKEGIETLKEMGANEDQVKVAEKAMKESK